MKKKKPVTREGYLLKKPAGLASLRLCHEQHMIDQFTASKKQQSRLASGM
jgi:hypothetical protein